MSLIFTLIESKKRFYLFIAGGFLLADFTLSGAHQPKRGREIAGNKEIDSD